MLAPGKSPLAERNVTAPVTQEVFDEMFAGLRALPSFLQIVQSESHKPDTDVTTWYHTAVEEARDGIYATDETQAHKEGADRCFLNDVFGSSDGAETRLVVQGFKPVAFVSSSFKKSDVADMIGTIPLADTTTDVLLRYGTFNSGLGFTLGDIVHSENPKSVDHSGFVYNSAAVEKVVAHNSGLLAALGHDTTLTGMEFAEEVLSSKDMVSQSILLGYSPFTALYFYIKFAGDLSSWDGNSDIEGGSEARIANLWEAAETLMTPSQLAFSQYLAAKPAEMAGIDIFTSSISNEDYIYRTPANTAVQETMVASGLDAYINDIRTKMYGADDDFLRTML